jgi:hypothetical protein
MGIGRRDFLVMFGSTLAALAAQPLSAVVALEDDLYLNRKLGLAFRKPFGWHFADVRAMGELAAGQILAIDDPEIKELWTSAEALPLATVSEEPITSPAGRFTPGISAFVEALPQGEPSALEVAAEDLSYLPRFLRGVELIANPSTIAVSRSDAAEYRVAFRFEHEEIANPTDVTMRALLIHQADRRYTFRMYDTIGGRIDFDKFIDTIRVL